MNKTVSINLGGLFFHIDEDAYQKLNRYFDAIRRSLTPDGKDEIMSDIEGRIAELLSEKLKNDKQVVSLREVDEVIAVMGQPEDYRLDEDTAQKSSSRSFVPGYNPIRTRKFYRDGDKAMVGGVCAGLAHYFRIDPLWIRILFIISLFVSFGTSIFVYLLLWILIPKAITTTEKLEMTGEPINISNIERKVREEIETVGERIQNVDYEKLGANARHEASRVGNGLGNVFSAIFKAFAKVIGAIIAITSAIGIGSLVVMLIVALFTSSMASGEWRPVSDIVNFSETPLWIIALTGFFVAAIPLFALFLLGLKILVDNLKQIGNVTRYTLTVVWIVALIALIWIGLRQASQLSSEGKSVFKEEIPHNMADTLHIKFRYNDYFTKSVHYNTDFRFTQDAEGNDVIYSNDIALYILKTDEARPFLQIEKISWGASSTEARKRAEKINYGFEIEGNNLILDNYLLTDMQNKFRNQKVEVFLYLPEGTVFHPDMSVQQYDNTDNDFFDLWFDGDTYIYKMEKDRVKCLNCVAYDENGVPMPEFEGPQHPGHPEPPVPPTDIRASEKGHVHISNEDVRVNLNMDSVKVNISSRNR